MFGISEIAIVLIIAILILGVRRLPALALSLGTSTRILKREAKAMKNDTSTAAAPPTIPGEVTRHGPVLQHPHGSV
jgi:sec-independent protein translocase protein TatA